MRRKIHLTTCAWGAWHLAVLEQSMLPTLVSAGNLPALTDRLDAVYTIATTAADHQKILAWPIYRRLAELVTVRFVTDRVAPDVSYHVDWYNTAIENAPEAGALCLMLPPDVAWSDRTLRHIAD